MQYGIRDLTLGSSGTDIRYLSREALKLSTEHPVIFLIDFGMELKSLGPFTDRLANLILWIRVVAVVLTWGTRQ